MEFRSGELAGHYKTSILFSGPSSAASEVLYNIFWVSATNKNSTLKQMNLLKEFLIRP